MPVCALRLLDGAALFDGTAIGFGAAASRSHAILFVQQMFAGYGALGGRCTGGR